MNNVIKITMYTMRDQMRHKSFYVLLGLSILFILTIRGCYDSGYTVNGKMVDTAAVAWHVSKIVFHLIAAGMFLTNWGRTKVERRQIGHEPKNKAVFRR